MVLSLYCTAVQLYLYYIRILHCGTTILTLYCIAVQLDSHYIAQQYNYTCTTWHRGTTILTLILLVIDWTLNMFGKSRTEQSAEIGHIYWTHLAVLAKHSSVCRMRLSNQFLNCLTCPAIEKLKPNSPRDIACGLSAEQLALFYARSLDFSALFWLFVASFPKQTLATLTLRFFLLFSVSLFSPNNLLQRLIDLVSAILADLVSVTSSMLFQMLSPSSFVNRNCRLKPFIFPKVL